MTVRPRAIGGMTVNQQQCGGLQVPMLGSGVVVEHGNAGERALQVQDLGRDHGPRHLVSLAHPVSPTCRRVRSTVE